MPTAIQFRIPHHQKADRFRTNGAYPSPSSRYGRGQLYEIEALKKAARYQQAMLQCCALALGISIGQAQACMRMSTKIICTPAQFGVFIAERIRWGAFYVGTGSAMEIEYLGDAEAACLSDRMTHVYLSPPESGLVEVDITGILPEYVHPLSQHFGHDMYEALQRRVQPLIVMNSVQYLTFAQILAQCGVTCVPAPKEHIYAAPNVLDVRPNGVYFPKAVG